MKNSRQFSTPYLVENVEYNTTESITETTSPRKLESEMAILNSNPKIDRQLLAEHERLIATSKGVVRVKKRGADYNLSHPLARQDMPTDAYHLGKGISAAKTN